MGSAPGDRAASLAFSYQGGATTVDFLPNPHLDRRILLVPVEEVGIIVARAHRVWLRLRGHDHRLGGLTARQREALEAAADDCDATRRIWSVPCWPLGFSDVPLTSAARSA